MSDSTRSDEKDPCKAVVLDAPGSVEPEPARLPGASVPRSGKRAQRTRFALLPAILLACAGAILLSACAATPAAQDRIQTELFEIERQSHHHWLEGNVALLDEMMDDSFHVVALNGVVESKVDVIGRDLEFAMRRERAVQVENFAVEPEQVLLHGNTAVVISNLRIDGTAAGRRLPGQMAVLSVFVRERSRWPWQFNRPWRLTARSITPIHP